MMKTPVTAIVGFIELAAGGEYDNGDIDVAEVGKMPCFLNQSHSPLRKRH